MPSPIYDTMNNRQIPPPNQSKLNLIAQYNSFAQDPFTFMLQQRGIDIPKEYRNNPKGAVEYLVNSGKMSNEQLNYMKELARSMGVQLN